MARMNLCGQVFSSKFSGDCYRSAKGEDVIRTEDGKIRDRDFNIILDPELAADIKAQREADAVESARRDALAKELAGGDSDMEMVYRRHLWYYDGEMMRPEVVEGHTLWQVGRNAGGTFWIGKTDGQKIVWYDTEMYDEETGELLPDQSRPYPVTEWNYLGHC